MEIIPADASIQFSSTDFQDEYQTRGFWLTSAAMEHQEINRQLKLTWIMLRTTAHSLMVHAQVLEAYIHLALMYTAYHIFPVLQIKYLINGDGDPTTPFKLATGTKPSISHLRVLFFPCVVWKAIAHVGKRGLNMRHQA